MLFSRLSLKAYPYVHNTLYSIYSPSKFFAAFLQRSSLSLSLFVNGRGPVRASGRSTATLFMAWNRNDMKTPITKRLENWHSMEVYALVTNMTHPYRKPSNFEMSKCCLQQRILSPMRPGDWCTAWRSTWTWIDRKIMKNVQIIHVPCAIENVTVVFDLVCPSSANG